MESSEETEKTAVSYYPYRPCFLLQEAIKAFVRCLGFESTMPKDSTTDPPSTTDPGAADPPTPDISTTSAFRRPQRPPVSSGSGPQTN